MQSELFRKDKRINAIERIVLIDNLFEDEEIRKSLKQYLDFRRKFGLSSEQWEKILLELKSYSNDRNTTLKIIENSYLNSWKRFYPLKKYEYGNNNVVQNYNTNYKNQIGKDNNQRLQETVNNLAKDNNGNYLVY